MAIQTVKTGAAVNDGTGDDARTAFTKINQNFTTNSHAASRLVGAAAGNVMEVGAFGLGVKIASRITGDLDTLNLPTGFYSGSSFSNAPIPTSPDIWGYLIQQNLASAGAGSYEWQIFGSIDGDVYLRAKVAGKVTPWSRVWTQRNTTLDSNGFIKAASPIAQLFADKIELNGEAKLQDITFEKLGVGDYLVKGSLGFAQEGWYIEMPKDANGNALVAVVYEQLANNDISVKTYDYMLNKKGRIVPDLETPLDIPAARWIDIRLQELPQTDVNPADETVAADAE